MRNVLAKVSKGHEEMVAATIRTIFAQPGQAEVRAQVDLVADMLAKQFPTVAELLHDAKADLTAFADFPHAHWRKIWSTNPQERLNREIRRRTDVVGIFLRVPLALVGFRWESAGRLPEGPGVTRNLSVGPSGLDPVGASPPGPLGWSRDLRAAC
jgi:hypothetical protein